MYLFPSIRIVFIFDTVPVTQTTLLMIFMLVTLGANLSPPFINNWNLCLL